MVGKQKATPMSPSDVKILIETVEKYEKENQRQGCNRWARIWEMTSFRDKTPEQLRQRYLNYRKKFPKMSEVGTAFVNPRQVSTPAARPGHHVRNHNLRRQQINSDEEAPVAPKTSLVIIVRIAKLVSGLSPQSLMDDRILTEISRIVGFTLDRKFFNLLWPKIAAKVDQPWKFKASTFEYKEKHLSETIRDIKKLQRQDPYDMEG